MRREDFEILLERLLVSVVDGGNPPSIKAFQKTAELRDAVISAWDAQAAELAKRNTEYVMARAELRIARAELEKLRKNAWNHPACRACASNRVYQPGMTDEQVRAGLEKLCGQRFDDEVWDEVARAWHVGIQHVYEILENRGLPLEDVPHVEPTGVPLTTENAPRARVVEYDHCAFIVDDDGYWYCNGWRMTEFALITHSATVLAWRKP